MQFFPSEKNSIDATDNSIYTRDTLKIWNEVKIIESIKKNRKNLSTDSLNCVCANWMFSRAFFSCSIIYAGYIFRCTTCNIEKRKKEKPKTRFSIFCPCLFVTEGHMKIFSIHIQFYALSFQATSIYLRFLSAVCVLDFAFLIFICILERRCNETWKKQKLYTQKVSPMKLSVQIEFPEKQKRLKWYGTRQTGTTNTRENDDISNDYNIHSHCNCLALVI